MTCQKKKSPDCQALVVEGEEKKGERGRGGGGGKRGTIPSHQGECVVISSGPGMGVSGTNGRQCGEGIPYPDVTSGRRMDFQFDRGRKGET